MPDIIGEIEKKYQEIQKAKPTREPILPRGARPVPPYREPIQEKVSPLQRQIRKRILPRVKIA